MIRGCERCPHHSHCKNLTFRKCNGVGIPITGETRLGGIERSMDLPCSALMAFNDGGRASEKPGVAVSELAPEEETLGEQEKTTAHMSSQLCHERKVATGNKRCNLYCWRNTMISNEKPLIIVPPAGSSEAASSLAMSDKKPEYRPIDCSVYDLFEAAALRRRNLLLTVGGRSGDYRIEDVFAKGKEEFLVVLSSATGERSTIRLDSIDLIVDPSDKKSYFLYSC